MAFPASVLADRTARRETRRRAIKAAKLIESSGAATIEKGGTDPLPAVARHAT